MATLPRRREPAAFARSLRAGGSSVPAVAAALRARYALNGRVAVRLACGWSQADAAAAWTARWPDDPKSFKNISYWENWPSPTGHAPSLTVLDRLAQVYGCDVTDLVAGWGEHAAESSDGDDGTAARALAWEVDQLDLPQLAGSLGAWSRRFPRERRRSVLLKLSTAASVAATASPVERSFPVVSAGIDRLEGSWTSSYQYGSTGRNAQFEGTHRVILRAEAGRLLGRSQPHPSGSQLDLDLAVDGNLATGSWTERTSPHGYYRAATYHGVLQLVVDPTGRSMEGMWLGLGKRFTVKSGAWTLRWEGPSTHRPVP